MFDMLFLQILNMSFTASVIILFVLLARILFKKIPKIFSYALWSVVIYRLVCPLSFESFWSLSPINANPIPSDIMYAKVPQVSTGIAIINDSINAILPVTTPYSSMNPMQGWIFIGTCIWLVGIATLLIYSVISFVRLKNRLKDSIHEKDNIYTSNSLDSPFVMGIFHPKIYLPATLSNDERQYIILHEQTHIRHLDHIVKLLSFFVLCLHWFNPFVWVAFFISGRDMEMSCDESVINKLGNVVKKDYSSSLLMLATGRRIVNATPLAFGEGDTKSRIKNVLNYKKPAFWVIIIAVVAVVILGIGLLANPKNPASKVNIIYSTKLTEPQKSEITTNYQLSADSNIFQTKFQVSDNIKSYAYYVELYQRGTFLGTYVQMQGNLNDNKGSITTAFSNNHGEMGQWESILWMLSTTDNYITYPAVPFPEGFVPQGMSTVTLTDEGKAKEMPQIVPEQPIIIASIGVHSANSQFSAYSCDYLMENPEAISQYECMYLVKCVFSEKDETELSKLLG